MRFRQEQGPIVGALLRASVHCGVHPCALAQAVARRPHTAGRSTLSQPGAGHAAGGNTMTRVTAAVCRAGGDLFGVEELVIDDPRPDEVLVRFTAAGLCHTDLEVAA